MQMCNNKNPLGDYITELIGWSKYGFKNAISKSKRWFPDSTKEFSIKTKGIEEIYLDYDTEYAVIEMNLKAEDPVGFSYNKNIKEFDVKNKWSALKKK
jgi:hypothetical protein